MTKNIHGCYLLISASILLVCIFPIFGQNGYIISNASMWITSIICIFYFLFKERVVFNRFIIAYLGYIAFSIVSVVWSRNTSAAYSRIIDMSMCLCWIIAINSYCNIYNDNASEKFQTVFVAGTTFISLYCLIIELPTLSIWARLGNQEFMKAGQGQIYYTCVLIYSMIILIYRIIANKRSILRVLYSALFVFLYLCGILTAVRKTMIIPVVFLIVIIWCQDRRQIVKMAMILLVAAIIGSLTLHFIYKYVPSMALRLQSLLDDFSSSSNASVDGNSYERRKWLIQNAKQRFLKHPILGVGIGQSRFYAADKGLDMYAHNNFMEVLANTGCIGFVIYYFVQFKTTIKAFKLSRNPENLHAGYVFSFFVAIFVMEYGQVDYYQTFYIMIPLLMTNYIDDYKCCFTWERRNRWNIERKA